ncbi:MAG: sulfatase-like hydrolase/transferase [Bacteroidota bacterium]
MSLRIYLLLVPIFFLACQQQERTSSSKLKHVLFIISDDLAAYALGSYGQTLFQTPNIDRLAAQSVLFENAYANSPMCTPSRASFITGRYAHAAGVSLLRSPLPDSTYTLAEHLKKSGFQTGIFGKNHFNSELKHGFDTIVDRRQYREYLSKVSYPEPDSGVGVRPTWKPFRDPARIWLNADANASGLPYDHSQATFVAREAVNFLKANKDQPTFCMASFFEPHSPFNFSNEFYGTYDGVDPPVPTTSSEDDQWVPEIFRDMPDEDQKGITRAYHTSVRYLDQNVGYILDQLEEMGIADETLIVFFGDHGYLLGHHKRFEKHMMWEEAVRVPLLVKNGSGTKRISDQVELVDVVPTVLDMMGLPALTGAQGESLSPIIAGAPKKNPLIYAEYMADNKAMVSDGRYKYIFTSGKRDLGQGYATGNPPTGILHRLYDLENDPHEAKDISREADYQVVLKRLQAALLKWFRDTHPLAGSISSDLSLDEQLSLYCEPLEEGDPMQE